MTVTVLPAGTNHAPVVNAGPNQTIVLPTSTVTLTGSVTDDGLPNPPGAVAVLWSEASGPAPVTFSDPGQAVTTVSFSQPGVYTLVLAASDSELVSSASVTVTVSSGGPVVSAGPNQTITLPTTSVALAGQATSPSGAPLTVSWSQVSGPGVVSFASPAALATSAGFDAAGVYDLRLTASDGTSTGSADVWVVVQAAAPQGPPPVVALTSPTEGASVRSPVDVVGTASSASLYSWTSSCGARATRRGRASPWGASR